MIVKIEFNLLKDKHVPKRLYDLQILICFKNSGKTTIARYCKSGYKDQKKRVFSHNNGYSEKWAVNSWAELPIIKPISYICDDG